MSALSEAVTLLQESNRKTLRAIGLAEGYLEQLKILGETPEKRDETLKAFEGLTAPELREAITQYKEHQNLLTYLDKGPQTPGATG